MYVCQCAPETILGFINTKGVSAGTILFTRMQSSAPGGSGAAMMTKSSVPVTGVLSFNDVILNPASSHALRKYAATPISGKICNLGAVQCKVAYVALRNITKC